MYDTTAFLYDATCAFEGPENTCEDVHYLLTKQGVFPPGTLGDLGAGTGLISILLAQKGWEVYGIERSEAMRAVAQTKAHKLPLDVQKKLSFHPGDITRYHLPPGHAFSGAICLCNTINHLVEPHEVEGFLHSTAQALRPGGVLILDSDRLETFEGFFNHPPTVVWDDGKHCMTRFCEFDLQTGRAYHTATLEKYISAPPNPEKKSKIRVSQESMMLQYHPQEYLEVSFSQAGFQIAEALLYNPCPQLYQGFYPKILWILKRTQ